MFSLSAIAGGISIGGSRVVFPEKAPQTTLSVSNKSNAATYLIQAWVEKNDGTKTTDFIITPPLYTSAPGNENTLRIISAGVPHAQDRESLYYVNIKAIPSVNKKQSGEHHGGVVVATQMQIKMFVRPEGLTPLREKATDTLVFRRQGTHLSVCNPTPYYLTLTNLQAGGHKLQDIMIPPRGEKSTDLPAGSGNTVSWSAINDFGGLNKGQSTLR